MSLATDTNTGGVIDGIAARFAEADAERMRRLDEEIRAGRRETSPALCPCGCLAPLRQCAVKARAEQHRLDAAEVASHAPSPGKPGTSPTPIAPVNAAPAPATPAKEETMPRGKPAEPKTCCGSRGTKHLNSCKGTGKSAPPQPARPKQTASGDHSELERLVIEDLLELRRSIDAELKRRRDEATEQLRKLTAALGEAA